MGRVLEGKPNLSNEVEVEEDGESQVPMLGALCTPREGSGPVDTDGVPMNGFEKGRAQEKAMVNVLASFVLSRQGSCSIETESVYGAAIVLPQLARSVRWQRELTISAFRSYMFVVLSIVMQLLILMMMEKHETVLDPFAGQMFLCDMGAFCTGINEDPEACKGPGGTTISPPRLYSYDIWSTRVFIRDSLKAIFPTKADEIDKVADPGEYGMESYNCRLLCCVLFMMTMLQEARNIFETAWLLYKVPTDAESWIMDEDPDANGDLDHGCVPGERDDSKGGEPRSTEPILEEDWLERINLQIAGMPMKWKLINVLILLIPKAMIWQLTVTTGIVFLMETAGIDDLVVNSVALTFILDIDELCCKTLTEEYIRGILSRVRPFPLFNFSRATERYGSEDILWEQSRQELNKKMRFQDFFWALFPSKLLYLLGACLWFIYSYYTSHCNRAPFGIFPRFWPKPLYLAKSTAFSFVNAFLPSNFPVPTETEAIWTMPE